MPDDRTVYPPAPGAHFEAGGRPYFLPRLVQEDKRAFHAWANAKALADLKALESLCCRSHEEPSPERPLTYGEYAYALTTTTTNVTSGHYAYHEAGGWARRRTLEGMVYLCFLALRRQDPAVTWAEIWTLAQDHEEALRQAFEEANSDPNPPILANGQGTPTPGTGAAPGPSSLSSFT